MSDQQGQQPQWIPQQSFQGQQTNSQPQWPPQQYTQQTQYGPPQQSFPQQPQWGQQSPQQYGYPQQMRHNVQPPQPRPKRKIGFILGIVAVLVLLACIGAGVLASHSNNTGTVIQNTQSTTSSTTSAPAQTQHFKVGQIVKVGDTWNVTLNSTKTSKGQEFSTPKSGMIYLLIDVSLKNISSSEQNVSSLAMFTLRDSTGQEYTETITTFTKPPDGKVEAGAPLRGTLAYEVPTTQHQFTFSFTSDIASTGQSIWDVHV